MRQLVALVAAVVMIVGAIVIRSQLDDREVARTVRLVCAQELEAVCTSLSDRLVTTVEPAGTTAGRLATAAGDPGLDGWLVLDPWPELVDQRRRRNSLPELFESRPQRLARSPLVMVVWNERATALQTRRCPQQVNWRCLGEAIAAGPWTASNGRPEWDRIKPGHASPATSAAGLLVLGHAVSGWFERTDLSTNDLDDDDFDRWFSALERAVPTPDPPEGALQRMLIGGPSVYDAVGTTEAEANLLLNNAPRRSEVRLLYPSPVATADVVLASAAKGSTASSLRRLAGGDAAVRSLTTTGWRDPKAASPDVPDKSGLPSPGLLHALQDRWRQVTGR